MKAESIVKVSTKGQIVIPKQVRSQFGIVPGKKLLIAVEENEILIKKLEDLSLRELSKRLTRQARKERVDVDALVDEAIRWARK
jgi:AbrB family looped-hinge helix DNA binding protein